MVDPEAHVEVSHKSMKPQLQLMSLQKIRLPFPGERGKPAGDALIPVEVRN